MSVVPNITIWICTRKSCGFVKRMSVKETQPNHVHMTLLNEQYKREFSKFFSSGNQNCSLAVSNGTDPLSYYFQFGWMLFLSLRSHVFSGCTDMATCTNALISIIAILVMHIPVNFRRFSLDDSTQFVRRGDKGVDLVASFCNVYHTSEEDLLNTIQKANTLIVHNLKKSPCPASLCQAEELKDINTDGFTYFEGLMNEDTLASSIRILEKDHGKAIFETGELDEQILVNDDQFGLGNVERGIITKSGLKRKCDAVSPFIRTITSPPSLPSSPVKETSASSNVVMPPPTPVSIAMTSAKWFRTVIAPLPDKPSTELQCLFASCDSNIYQHIKHRAQIILEVIFPSSGLKNYASVGSLRSVSLTDTIWAELRRMETLKLYYRVLAYICRKESRSKLTSLLSNERFHRSMLACSAELVMTARKRESVIFSDILQLIGITAFDLSKMIEDFVKHDESFPRELKQWLNSVEERIVESMAWEKGSSMYNSLIVANLGLAAEIKHLGLLSGPMPALDAIAVKHNLSSEGFSLADTTKTVEASSDENTGAPSLPPRTASTSPATSIGVVVRISCNKSCIVSSTKEKPSDSSGVNKSQLLPLQSACISSQRTNPTGGSEDCAEIIISNFFQKVLSLATIRIKSLCEQLQQPHHVTRKVCDLVQHLLIHRTSLFFNRHIDQLILCSMYAISKVCHLNLTFREIISNFTRQTHCKPRVFRNVFVDWPSTEQYGKARQEAVDIIGFYNGVFIPSAKCTLIKLISDGNPHLKNRYGSLKEDNK
eukprot:Gb_26070 [translate_table: standard]